MSEQIAIWVLVTIGVLFAGVLVVGEFVVRKAEKNKQERGDEQ